MEYVGSSESSFPISIFEHANRIRENLDYIENAGFTASEFFLSTLQVLLSLKTSIASMDQSNKPEL